MAPAHVTDDTRTHIDRIKQMIRLLCVSDEVMSWDGYDDLLVATLPVKFCMLDIENTRGLGTPVSTCSCTTFLCADTG